MENVRLKEEARERFEESQAELEEERRKKWLELPRQARLAIRWLHNQFGHKPKDALIEILKASK